MSGSSLTITSSLSPSERSPLSPRIPFLFSHIPTLCLLCSSYCYYPVSLFTPSILPHVQFLLARASWSRFLSHLQWRTVPIHNYTLFRSHPVPIRFAYKPLQFYSPILPTNTSTTRYGPFPFMYTHFVTLLHALPFALPSKSDSQHLQHCDPNTR